jgi:hypothetical protein
MSSGVAAQDALTRAGVITLARALALASALFDSVVLEVLVRDGEVVEIQFSQRQATLRDAAERSHCVKPRESQTRFELDRGSISL